MELLLSIPVPPEFDDENNDIIFLPIPEMNQFVSNALLTEGSGLYNAEHGHLARASIGFLWTNQLNKRRGRRVVGEAEILNLKGGAWQKARQVKQVLDWFGHIPDFIVTFDYGYVADCDPIQFLALLEHELYHCGQAVDMFGFPKFRKSDGMPIFAIRGHDVEEFSGVIRRYGSGAAGENVADFVAAAAIEPEISRANIAELCGLCFS